MTAAPVLALAQLTAIELPPPQFVAVAAHNGCASAGLRLIPVVPGGAAYPLMDDPTLLEETLRVVREPGWASATSRS